MSEKFVYAFDEGDKSMKQLLGGKGANLCEMTKMGIPVPFGFTVTTDACAEFYNQGKKFPEGMQEGVDENLAKLEKHMGANLNDPENPLLLSVRSGAAVSMPGMMDTVLNLGMNDTTVHAVAKKTGNERFDFFMQFGR